MIIFSKDLYKFLQWLIKIIVVRYMIKHISISLVSYWYRVDNFYIKLCFANTIVLVRHSNCHLSQYFSAFSIEKQIMGMVHWILLTLNRELVSVDIGYKIFLCALFFGGHKMQLRTKKSYFKIKRIIYYVQADWLAECKKSNHYQKFWSEFENG